MASRPDYGAKGCCGPAAFVLIAGVLGSLAFGLTEAVRWLV